MDPLQFVYWLQGWLELGDIKEATPEQIKIIKEHIALVLTKVTGGSNGQGKLTPLGEIDCWGEEIICSPATQEPLNEAAIKKLLEEVEKECKQDIRKNQRPSGWPKNTVSFMVNVM